jgi:plastocyanin
LVASFTVTAIGAYVAPVLAATRTVDIHDNAYGPQSITVNRGDTVSWTNHDSVKHTVTSNDGGPLDSGNFGEGQAYAYTFGTAGTYSYYCEVHPNMRGSVAVQAAAAKATPAPKPDPTAAPPAPVAATQPPAATVRPVSADPTARPRPVAVSAGAAAADTRAVASASPPRPAVAAPASASPVPTTDVVTAPQPASSNETLDPMLLLAAITAGVVVFALLALGRPRRLPASPPPARGSTKQQTDEAEAAVLTIEVPVAPPPPPHPPARRTTTPPPTKILTGAGR